MRKIMLKGGLQLDFVPLLHEPAFQNQPGLVNDMAQALDMIDGQLVGGFQLL